MYEVVLRFVHSGVSMGSNFMEVVCSIWNRAKINHPHCLIIMLNVEISTFVSCYFVCQVIVKRYNFLNHGTHENTHVLLL